MASLISFTTPLPANGTVSSGSQFISRATTITGTVIANVAGTVNIDQGGDGINFDTTTTISVGVSTGVSINVPVISQYFQVRYINGGNPQTAFRLYVNARDPYGAFLANALPPSSGGAYGVLLYNVEQDTYQYVGRYDGADELGAITAAVNYKNVAGKYAAFQVGNAIVSSETPIFSTEHAPDSF